jgi:hypothetical protein
VVARHVGGVHGLGGADAESVGNHLVLTVSGWHLTHDPTGGFVGVSFTTSS